MRKIVSIVTDKKNLFALLMLFATVSAFARLGGSGGDGFSDSDSGDDGGMLVFIIELIYYLIFLPFPWNILSIGTVIFIGYLMARGKRQQSVLNKVSKLDDIQVSQSKITSQTQRFSNFNPQEFQQKVGFAFTEMQQAWSKKEIGKIRRFISDGVYQRLNAQIMMMDALSQSNIIEGLNIIETKIVNAYTENDYELIEMKIAAHVRDKFVSEKFPRLNQSFSETFVEYWTFIRKQSASGADLYFSNKCPSCHHELPQDLGEVAVCPACGTFCNLGDYDWVLSEITLAVDYALSGQHQQNKQKITERLGAWGDLATVPQMIEDKASNAFLQIRIAAAMNDAKRVRRFSDDHFFNQFERTGGEGFLFNRLYLSSVSLVNLFEQDEFYFAVCQIMSHEQTAVIQNNKLKMQSGMMNTEYYLVLKREIEGAVNQQSVFSHKCVNCGGSVEDSLDLECPFCGQLLNNAKLDWLVYDLLSAESYRNIRARFGESLLSERQERSMETQRMRPRDYSINNLIVILACDGDLSDKEKQSLRQIARSFGYNVKRIEALWENNQVSRMAIMIPQDEKMREKSWRQIKSALDKNAWLGVKEAGFLDEVKKAYGC